MAFLVWAALFVVGGWGATNAVEALPRAVRFDLWRPDTKEGPDWLHLLSSITARLRVENSLRLARIAQSELATFFRGRSLVLSAAALVLCIASIENLRVLARSEDRSRHVAALLTIAAIGQFRAEEAEALLCLDAMGRSIVGESGLRNFLSARPFDVLLTQDPTEDRGLVQCLTAQGDGGIAAAEGDRFNDTYEVQDAYAKAVRDLVIKGLVLNEAIASQAVAAIAPDETLCQWAPGLVDPAVATFLERLRASRYPKAADLLGRLTILDRVSRVSDCSIG